MKYDNDKPKIHLVPPEAIYAIASVFGFGAVKYGENNWRRDIHKYHYSRHYSSAMRHLLAFHSGEDTDPESGLPHIAHAMTQLIILYMTTQEAPEMDDRYKKEVDDAEGK